MADLVITHNFRFNILLNDNIIVNGVTKIRAGPKTKKRSVFFSFEF